VTPHLTSFTISTLAHLGATSGGEDAHPTGIVLRPMIYAEDTNRKVHRLRFWLWR
jgi:hypothetical protein